MTFWGYEVGTSGTARHNCLSEKAFHLFPPFPRDPTNREQELVNADR